MTRDGSTLRRWLRGTLGRILPGRRAGFPGSEEYWERRYAGGGNSGGGSYGPLAGFKAEVLNAFVDEQEIRTVIEFGCGDGNQLALATYPSYTGLDVSQQAIAQCRARFTDDATKSFHLLEAYDGRTAELALSLDVVYHLVEDAVFEDYMTCLFAAATRFVIVYSSNHDEFAAPHVRHRKFEDWVGREQADWTLDRVIPNELPWSEHGEAGSHADFYVYRR